MDAVATTDFTHVFEPGTDMSRPPLLLLHGTGGDERDLLPLGRMVAPGASLLSPRGKVLEGAMPRFFRRLSEGVFDEDDLRRRTHELADFVDGGPPALRSRGAGRGRLLQRRQHRRRHAAASSGGAGRRGAAARDVALSRSRRRAIFPASASSCCPGALDPIVPAEDAGRLARSLTAGGALVDHTTLPAGHGLSQADVGLLRGWLERA